MGDHIYQLVKQPDIRIVVEIGTWNGLGSTACIRDALIDSGKSDWKVYSLEVNKALYALANENNQPTLNGFHIVHGRVVDEIPILFEPALSAVEHDWLRADLHSYTSCENVLDILPQVIDLLILDGGEFTSEREFATLGPRSRHIILDDTSNVLSRKNWRVRQEILSKSDEYNVVIDMQADRNGWTHAVRSTNVSESRILTA